MCEKLNQCINRASFLSFVIPFVVGGIWFSYIGLTFVDTLPSEIVSIYDRMYVVVVAFVDMGFAFGVVGFTILSFIRQMRSLLGRMRRPKSA